MKTFLKLLIILIIGAAVAGVILYFGNGTAQKPSNTASEASEGIIISEVMSSNKGIFPDDKGNNSDWVELYNTTGSDIDMNNFVLSDDEAKPAKWPFPQNITLKAHGYLIVYLSGDSNTDVSKGIIHCTFKLSSQGEKLVLSSGAPSKTVDAVDIPKLPDNFSYALMDGSWQQTANITPGFENSDAGFEAYKASMAASDSTLLINEVMTSNAMTIIDDKGGYSDWVEIANTGNADVNLKGCGLSDNVNDLLKWRFPDVTIKAGQQLVVFCSGVNTPYNGNGSLYAGFKLSSYNSQVSLSDARGRLIDSVKVGEMSSDWSYGRISQNGTPTSQWLASSTPSPGYPNTEAGFSDFEKNNQVALGDIVISEVLSSNNKTETADGGKSDFIEVENRGSGDVNLKGYGLTDNASNPAKFRFPDVTLQPGKQIAVITNGTSNTNGYLSAPFKLSKLGGTIALFNAQDQLQDRYFLGAQQQNLSMGRAEGSNEIAFFEPTPGAANGEGKAGFVADVQFDKQPGKYDGAIQLTLSSSEGADIYYTTDGSEPNQNSSRYSGPISIDKTTPIRAKAFKQEYIDSGMTTATYLINTKHTLPVVSIVTKESNLFDKDTGIYELGPNPGSESEYYPTANFRSDTEVPASFEVYDESGKRVFQQDIGLAMTGGVTLGVRDQKSLAIYARTKYGKGTMAYPFFQNRNFTEYKSLILRTGGREGAMVTKLNTYVALSLVDGQMNIVTQAAKPCVVYIDGKYWGVYYLMEKRNKYMVAQHEGITDNNVIDKINLVKGNGGVVNNGSGDGYKEIYNYIKNNDMSKKEHFDWVAARMDTDSYMDLMINEIYIANNDPSNLQCYQIPPDGKWKQIYQDMDIAFYSFDTVKLRINPQTRGSDIFNGLRKYKPWFDKFIERFAWALKNVYSKDRVTAAIDDAANLYRGEVEAERERWSDERPSLDKWESDVNAMKSFAKKRGRDVVDDLKQHFTLTQEQKQMLEDAIK